MTALPLSRSIFKTTRLSEFASKKELINQTGHAVGDWPLVILKELVDNAIEACEEVGAAPFVKINVAADEITIEDNGPGLAAESVAGMLEFNYRMSSRQAYVSPTRGAQGNALKTILAMPFALDGERGETLIESQGVAHRIIFTIDPIHREQRIEHELSQSEVKTGARVTVRWPNSASSILDEARTVFYKLAQPAYSNTGALGARGFAVAHHCGDRPYRPALVEMAAFGPNVAVLVRHRGPRPFDSRTCGPCGGS